MKTLLFILGTRPEAIKLAPIISRLRQNPEYKIFVCNTEQQKELSNQTLGYFGIKADFGLDIMCSNQTLLSLQSRLLEALSELFNAHNFDAVIVQGDTMSAFCGALAGFYSRMKVFHVEAGLRSYDLCEPFPEEALRQMISRVSDLHFAPTALSAQALKNEGISDDKIHITGNSVIDALLQLPKNVMIEAKNALEVLGVRFDEKIVLVTAHRRENHGKRLDSILSAISVLARKFYDHQFILPVHPNPNVCDKAKSALCDIPNVILTEPLDYPQLVCVMKEAKLILTDSGGIQEEAPTFGVPILVMRYETEREEGIEAGFAKLVGADRDLIITESSAILSYDRVKLDGARNPYGDGRTAERIANIIKDFWND